MKSRLYMMFGLAGVLTLVSISAFGQQTEFNGIASRMNHISLFQQAYPQEKVYLHFDNTGYFKGETIFFKAYVTRADNGKPSDISKVLYVEILNPSGDIVQKRKLHIENGEANGDLQPDSIVGTGFYEIRAYTRYMLNFGKDAVFSRVFPIFKKPDNPGDYSNPTIAKLSYNRRLPEREFNEDTLSVMDRTAVRGNSAKDYHVNIYPEGGNMVEGLPCKVAFTVTDREHNPTELIGEIVDASGSTITIINSSAEGKGLFYIPRVGKGMKMVLYSDKKKRMSFDMPEVKDEGISLSMETVHGDDIVATIHSSELYNGKLLGYTLMNGGMLSVADTITSEKAFEVEFPRKTLKPGVNQLTVFNAEGRILAERLFFICPTDTTECAVSILSETETIRPCGNVKLKLHTKPKSRMSFSAMDATTLPNGTYGNINTYMLLSSDVRGYIPHPEYYFEADDEMHRMAADTLMLINGWRRYDWKVMAGVSPWHDRIQKIEDKLYVTGYLHNRDKMFEKKYPVSGVDLSVYLYNEGGETLKGETRTDSTGYYAFDLPNVNGDWNMLIYTRQKDKLRNYNVSIDRRFAPESRYVMPTETSMIEKTEPNLTYEDKEDLFGQTEDKTLKREGKGKYVLPTATVKKKRYWSELSGTWYDESVGSHFATMFYDCDDEADRIADMGQDMPELYTWLAKKNPFFSDMHPKTSYFMDHLVNKYVGDSIDPEFDYIGCYSTHPVDEGIYENDFYTTSTSISTNLFADGYTYKHRPIIWILNNQYAGVTGAGNTLLHINGGAYRRASIVNAMLNDKGSDILEFDDFKVQISTTDLMPALLSDAKSIYINEDGRTASKMLYAPAIMHQNPVCIFVYTHRFSQKLQDKGLRRTHFQGFNIPTKFEMEDYNVVPPVADDFRRTLFWAPSVVADEKGKATVEFYNNSTCKDMYISVEGITDDGRFVNN